MIHIRGADVLHRPHIDVGPDDRLLGPLRGADYSAALRDAVRSRLIGHERDPLIEIPHIAPVN